MFIQRMKVEIFIFRIIFPYIRDYFPHFQHFHVSKNVLFSIINALKQPKISRT